jgi:hypothetical protein
VSVNLGTITFELTEASIQQAIYDLAAAYEKIYDAIGKLIESLAKVEGVTVAKLNLMTATGSMDEVVSGIGESIQGVYYPEERCGYIFSDNPQAVYLEYGTGIIGAANFHVGAAIGESTPPVMVYTTNDGRARTYTKYDTYEHGSEGWVYYNDMGEAVRTLGEPAGMFLYNTLKWLRERAPEAFVEQLKKGE